jgi:drug/metabolite transporter (DMT)-like permease
MSLPRKIPLRVVLGLAAAVLIDTALQIFWKTAVLKLPDETDSLASLATFAIFREPLFIVVVFIMSLQFFNWMAVLGHADLSFAQPFTALSYVSVGIISALFLGEAVDKLQMLGIACVIAGVWFISRTNYRTQRDSKGIPLPVEPASSHAKATRDLIRHEGVCSDC